MAISCLLQITAQKPTKDVLQMLNSETIKNEVFVWILNIPREPVAEFFVCFLMALSLSPFDNIFIFQNKGNLKLAIMPIRTCGSKRSVAGCSDRTVHQQLPFTGFSPQGLGAVTP
jgi:hypothetical protein